MTVRVRFFASLRDVVGTGELEIPLGEPVSLSALMCLLERSLPVTAMEALKAEQVRVAVNQTLAGHDGRIQPGDEVAFMPPVTGG